MILLLLKLLVRVKERGRIEIESPDLVPGDTVEITIHPMSPSTEKRSIIDILKECPGGVLFKTPEEVDAYIREERDSWS